MIYNVLNGRSIYLSDDGRFVLRIGGMDMQAKMPVITRAGDFLVFKRNGFNGWDGVGLVSYYPPEYILAEIADGRIAAVVEDVEVSRADWRSVKERLIARAIELDNERKGNQ